MERWPSYELKAGGGGVSELERLAQAAASAVEPEELVRLAVELVRIPSYYPGPGEAPVVDYLAGYLRARGFQVRVQEVTPGRPNLIADLGEGPGGLILEGHADVVTPGDEAAWRYPPFGGVLEGGRLYGRGAADMKGGLAAAIVASLAVRRVWGTPPRRLRLAVLADEEGMMAGVKAFVRAGHARGFRGAVVCEPEENEICLWQKGAMRVRMRFQGRMAHGAMPYAGANPIPAAALAAVRVAEMERRLQAALRHEQLGLPYLTPTVLQASAGEGQLNVIPPQAVLALDVRTVPGLEHGWLRRELEQAMAEALQACPGVSGELEVIEDRPATEIPPQAAVVRAAERALRLLGLPVRYGAVPGATDGTFLWAWEQLPIVTLGPGGRTVPHQADEFVEIDQVVQAARIYAALAVLMLGEP